VARSILHLVISQSLLAPVRQLPAALSPALVHCALPSRTSPVARPAQQAVLALE